MNALNLMHGPKFTDTGTHLFGIDPGVPGDDFAVRCVMRRNADGSLTLTYVQKIPLMKRVKTFR